jgi:type II secretory pathway component PulL
LIVTRVKRTYRIPEELLPAVLKWAKARGKSVTQVIVDRFVEINNEVDEEKREEAGDGVEQF